MKGWLGLGVVSMASLLWCADANVEFNRDVRPILSDKCFTCHGPDAAAKKVPFRLDTEAAAKPSVAGGDSSKLVRRITATNPALRMPPVYSGLKLTEREIDTLRTWAVEGAKWEKHWSFIAPRRRPLPQVANKSWLRNPIDSFILARLEKEGLKPSEEADKETLLRRVTFDLTGLPPTPAETEAFLRDTSREAYETVVDRLLASPRYGERMAERWLDAARYADTNGYQYDPERIMWRWRDWVIAAFNRNEPFNQFTLEQIAGDMLPNPTLDQKIATGFNRNHRSNSEDGIVPEEYGVEYVVDRVETTSTVFLGLTLGCARCHNHKYDPFTQKEFYQMFAYFNNVPELGRAMKYDNSPPLIPAPTAAQQAALKVFEQKIQAGREFLAGNRAAIDKAIAAREKEIAKSGVDFWAPAAGLEGAFPMEDAAEAKSMDGTVAYVPGKFGRAALFDGKAYLDAGSIAQFENGDAFTVSAWIYAASTPDGSLVSVMKEGPKGKGYGVHLNHGKVHVDLTTVWETDAIRVESEETLAPQRWYHVTVAYTGSRRAAGVHVYLDGRPLKMRVESDNVCRPYNNNERFHAPLRIGAGWGPDRRFRGLIDDLRIYKRALSSDEIDVLAVGEPAGAIAGKPAAARSRSETLALRWYFLENVAEPRFQQAWKKMIALRWDKEQFERTFPTVMVMAENPVPKETHLLIRGAYDKPGEPVRPGVPAVLPPLPAGAPNNRLGLAKWLIDPANPLMARVTVNRFWQMYFGTGIVKTTEDFGVQGEWPSHPELLDWLATEFIRTGWDVKAMQKLIVTSAAYRQSSKTTPELTQRDAENRLLARGPRFRLPAEMIRDQALFAAGLLKERIGGPSVKSYQPAGLWKELTMGGLDYVQDHGDDLYRRSLYIYWKRTVAPPMLANFDAAGRESCVVRETRTNTPLQALNLMNDVAFVEAARFLGQRMIKEGGADSRSRVRYGFRLTTGRAPSEREEQILRDNLQYHLDYFSGRVKQIEALLSQGESRSDPALDPRELAAYASVGSLLLNLDEAVTKN
jgi:Protein of unknown function (DUF1553)/Protein of unknown function (DUF1549)/Concanavalin A-like lectin/glucanases superfamily/Planctomycete cytochrome C